MRQDQLEQVTKVMHKKVEKILVALFKHIGAERLEQIIPDVDSFLLGVVDASYEGVYSEEDIDELLYIYEKYGEKEKLSEERVNKFCQKYFEENGEKISDKLLELE